MKTVRNLFLLALLIPALSACAYFEMEPGTAKTPPPATASKVDLTKKDTLAPSDPNVEVNHLAGPETQSDLASVIGASTKGEVEYTPLDGPAPSSMPPQVSAGSSEAADDMHFDIAHPSVSSAASAPVSSNDPSVEVFPLDADMGKSIPQNFLPHGMARRDVTEKYSDAAPQATHQPGAMVVYFDHDSTAVHNDDVKMLTTKAMAHSLMSGAVAVEGYASAESSIKDPVKRKVVNLKISMDRALSVSAILIQKGIPADQITTVAYGETRPAESAEKSRRVEISGLGN